MRAPTETTADGCVSLEQLCPGDTGQLAFVSEVYREFTITATAERRLPAVIIVYTTLYGGPRQIDRKFTVPSEASSALVACQEALADLRQVIDQLLA